MKEPTLFSDFLEALKVPHTLAYSSKAYRTYELLEHAKSVAPLLTTVYLLGYFFISNGL